MQLDSNMHSSLLVMLHKLLLLALLSALSAFTLVAAKGSAVSVSESIQAIPPYVYAPSRRGT